MDIGGNPIPMRLASSRWGLVDDDYLPPFQKHVYLPGSYVSGAPPPIPVDSVVGIEENDVRIGGFVHGIIEPSLPVLARVRLGYRINIMLGVVVKNVGIVNDVFQSSAGLCSTTCAVRPVAGVRRKGPDRTPGKYCGCDWTG